VTALTDDPRVARIIERFERLQRADVARLAEIYRDDARFKDPFNEVQGGAAIQRIFEHMFDSLDAPRFVILDAVTQGDQCFLRWHFHFRMKRFARDAQTIRGGSHLRLAPDGRISDHRDYWDAAEELYEKLPLLGGLMRWLKARVNA
jgi:ketosteroid isomerase-like protein